MATVYFPSSDGVAIRNYGGTANNGTTYASTYVYYYVRIAITETAVAYDTDTSTYKFELQCKNNRSGAMWSSTAQTYQPKLYLYVNDTKLSFTSKGASSASTTGYFRTAASAYTASTSWQTIATVTGLTTTNTWDHPASITIGFQTTAGTGGYSGPLGICTTNPDNTTQTYYNGSVTTSLTGGAFKHAWTADTTNGAFSPKTKVKFDACGGAKTGDSQPITAGDYTKYWRIMVYGQTANSEMWPPTREGWTYTGMYTTSSGGTQIYQPNSSTSTIAVANSTMWDSNSKWKRTPAGEIWLYAHWLPTYPVYLNVSGTWKTGVCWVNVSGTWKPVRPYVKDSDAWKTVEEN